MTNADIRLALKKARRQLPPRQRAIAQDAALDRLHKLAAYRRARSIAAFIGTSGELDPLPLLHTACAESRLCHVPVLHPFMRGRLTFSRWTPQTPMRANRFGILEPACDIDRPFFLNRFDLVIVPLLAFDKDLHRMGMGGGFYDRSFAYINRRRHWRRETLVGLAFDLQLNNDFEAAPWDIALDYVVTESRLYVADAR